MNSIDQLDDTTDNSLSKKKIIFFCRVLIPLLVAILSFTLLSNVAASHTIHENTITTLQTKQETVLKLSAASATIAAGASLVLGERANAVSNKLLDLTGYFVIILCAIMLEKYLVTILGLVSFKIIIPIACIIFSIFTIVDKEAMRKISIKLITFALIIFIIIPFSVAISNIIEKTYAEVNIQKTLEASEKISDDLDSVKVDIDNSVVSNENTNVNVDSTNATTYDSEEETKENTGIGSVFDAVGGLLVGAKDKTVETVVGIKDTVASAVGSAVSIVADKANEIISKLTNQLNNMIEVIAVMLVTTCVIPILTILFFLWIAKLIFSLDIKIDSKSIPKMSNLKR